MQIINEIYGGQTIKAQLPVHGKVSEMRLPGDSKIFSGLPGQFNVARYHSLICNDIRSPMRITAFDQNIPMAIEHEQHPVFGVQFHPESFMTEYGREIITNFISII